MFSRRPLIVTHDGHFHPDDVCAVAVLDLVLNGRYRLKRTRDTSIISRADYVVDVGGVYDPALHRFDHHQKGGAGARPESVPYASFGLVWREYGVRLCGDEEIAQEIDRKLVASIDALDNGVEVVKVLDQRVLPYYFADFLFDLNPGWKERVSFDSQFRKAVEYASLVLRREIRRSILNREGRRAVEAAYQSSLDKRIIVIDDDYPWRKVLMRHPEPLFIVKPRVNGSWDAKTVPVAEQGFESRASFPKSWRGLTEQDLSQISGVPDAMFCHNGGFIAIAQSKEGALALAKKALETRE